MAHPFAASKTGEISVKITALAPTSNAIVGLVWVQATTDGTCTQSTYQQNVRSVERTGDIGAIVSGRYCIIVYDAIGFTVPQTYTLTVSHP